MEPIGILVGALIGFIGAFGVLVIAAVTGIYMIRHMDKEIKADNDTPPF